MNQYNVSFVGFGVTRQSKKFNEKLNEKTDVTTIFHLKIDLKNRSKINPERSPGGPWGFPGDAWGPPRGIPGGDRDACRGSMTILQRPRRVPDLILGPGRVPKIDQKRTFGRKGGLREGLRKRFSYSRVSFRLFVQFPSKFRRFFDVFFDTFFDVSVRRFHTAEPSNLLAEIVF